MHNLLKHFEISTAKINTDLKKKNEKINVNRKYQTFNKNIPLLKSNYLISVLLNSKIMN